MGLISIILQMWVKYLFIILGWLSFGFGVLGFFLPIMPSVPFMILAAFFFSKGSNRIHAWLLSRPHIGQAIQEWESHRVLRKNVKWAITFSIIFMFSYPIFLLNIPAVYKGIMTVIAVIGLFVTWSFPSQLSD